MFMNCIKASKSVELLKAISSLLNEEKLNGKALKHLNEGILELKEAIALQN